MLVNSTPIKSEGDLGGHKVGLSFDQSSLAHIMSVLTDLYSDPELAVIREYSTNALDSHIEAGNKDPILVSTPTAIFPYFVVQDFGIGLSVDDIENIYSKYGASTKRSTNEQTGMLGLGCKSALTYTGQFNLTCVKDGEKALVSISRSEIGGTMEVVEVSPTDEPNGVKVSIPVKNASSLISKAKQFFSFWQDGTVLLDGKKPGYTQADTIYEDKDYKIDLVDNIAGDYIVMGNVAYRVQSRFYTQYSLNSVVAYVPMGAVNFTPSREDLHYTRLTEQTVAHVTKLITKSLIDSACKDIAAATSYFNAIERRDKWESKLGRFSLRNNQNVQYKGEQIPIQFSGFGLSYCPRRYRNKITRYGNYPRDFRSVGQNTYIMTDYPNKEVSKAQRDKIDIYCVQRKIGLGELLISAPGMVKEEKWFDTFPKISWADVIKEVKLLRKAQPKRPDATYEYWDEDTETWDETDSLTDDIVYCNQPERRKLSKVQMKQLTLFGTVACLPKNRWAKFQRDHPQAKHLSEVIPKILEASKNSLSDEDIQLIMGGSSDSWIVEKLATVRSKLLDPEVVAKIDSYSTKHGEALKKYKAMASWSEMIGKSVAPLPSKRMFEGYPLLYLFNSHNVNSPRTLNEIAIYMNAVYNLNKENK